MKNKNNSPYSELVRDLGQTGKIGRQSWVQPVPPLLRPVKTVPLIKNNSSTTEAALVKSSWARHAKELGLSISDNKFVQAITGPSTSVNVAILNPFRSTA